MTRNVFSILYYRPTILNSGRRRMFSLEFKNNFDLSIRNQSDESANVGLLILTAKNLTKSHRDYLQNTSHVVLRNCPSLSIATERITCLNNSRGVQLRTLA